MRVLSMRLEVTHFPSPAIDHSIPSERQEKRAYNLQAQEIQYELHFLAFWVEISFKNSFFMKFVVIIHLLNLISSSSSFPSFEEENFQDHHSTIKFEEFYRFGVNDKYDSDRTNRLM